MVISSSNSSGQSSTGPRKPGVVFGDCKYLALHEGSSLRFLKGAILSTSPSPELFAELYSYLRENEVDFRSAEAKQKLSLQFRDILIKQVTLIGAPQVIMALTPMAKAEGSPETKAKESVKSDKW